jgi:hypothetical protein
VTEQGALVQRPEPAMKIPKDALSPNDEPAPVEDIPAVLAEVAEPITLRPDGYYWTAPDGKQAFGPFDSYEDAFADMHSGDPDDLEPGETLSEAEAELGIADWIDPDTGCPAEGMGHPRLED